MKRTGKRRTAWALALLGAAALAGTGRCGAKFGTMGAVKSAGEALDKKTEAAAAAAACTGAQLAALERSMTDVLASTTTDADYTLLLEAADGRTYAHSIGASTALTPYQSASTSKLVAAVTILSLVDRGFLTLDAKASDLIPWWTTASTNPISGVTLRNLLSFTSGVSTEPAAEMGFCLSLNDYEGCVQQIYNLNLNNGIPPGSQFYYASTHLQVAGLMAINARAAADVSYSSWSAVFGEFKARTGLFPNSDFNLPFSTNPRLAGGMTWTGQDYMGFLRALYRGQVLSQAIRNELWTSQRGSAVVGTTPSGTSASPIVLGLGEDWPYDLGNWNECAPGTSCAPAGRNSSPGAYGAYPFDWKNRYFGILARQGPLGTFRNGVALYRTVQDAAAKWATKSCGN